MSISCNPSDLANAARCFSSCIPDPMAVRSLLLCQGSPSDLIGPNGQTTGGGNGKIAGCSAPFAPTGISSSAQTSSTITVNWSQAASPTKAIVRWGTSPGDYSSGSHVIVPAPTPSGTYTITGLNPSTTYYIIVQVYNGACGPGVSAELSQSTSGSTPAAVLDWVARVQTNGGAKPSNATIAAVTTWYNGLVADGIDSLIYSCSFFAPDSYAAALTPFFKVHGTDPYTINTSFTPSDPLNSGHGSADVGLISDSTDWLHTGINPADVFTGTSMGLVIYVKVNTAVSTPGQWGGGNGGRYGYFWTTTLASYAAFQLAFTNPTASGEYGFWVGSRTGANQLDIYCANGLHAFANVGSSASAAAGAVPASGNISFKDSSVATFPYNFSASNNIAFLGVAPGLSSAQAQALFNRTQTLRQAFGGGYT